MATEADNKSSTPRVFEAFYKKAVTGVALPTYKSFIKSRTANWLDRETYLGLREAHERSARLQLAAIYPIPSPAKNLKAVAEDPADLIQLFNIGATRPVEGDGILISLAFLEAFAEAERAISALVPDSGLITPGALSVAFAVLEGHWQSSPYRENGAKIYKLVGFEGVAPYTFAADQGSVLKHVTERRSELASKHANSPPRLETPTVYASRASDQPELPNVDALGLRPDARALAELICLKDPGPPLAIGLFGDWGAGKSTFMAMIEDQAGQVAQIERDAFSAAPDAPPPLFVQNLVQIRFNAWHYSEADLWSSLAAHIFRSLFEQAHEEGSNRPSWLTPEAFRQLLADLAQVRAVGLEAETTAADARRALSEAQVAADAARRHRDRLRDAAGGDLEALLDLVKTPEGRETLDQALNTIGAPEGLSAAARIAKAAQHARTAPGRLAALFNAMVSGPALLWGLGLAIIGGSGLLIAWDAGVEIPAQWWGALPALAGLAGMVGGGAIRGFNALAEITAAGDTLMEAAKQKAHEADAALVEAESALDAAEVALDQARRRRDGLEALADADNPEAALNAFLDARLGDGAYRDQLGVVSKLHDDFLALSRLLEEADRKHAEAMADEKTPAEDRKPPEHLQRIVLYIDDLDRCPDKTVIKVLEAVHLLLALPLFVVVVGVDGRWLEGALEREYADQLGQDGSASPSDYLEKIFQLPYWLPKLDTEDVKDGSFAKLVNALAPEAAAHSADAEDGAEEGAPRSHDDATSEGDGEDGEGESPGDGEIVWVDAPELTAAQQREALREQVTLSKEELDCIKALGPLIGKSPRAVKRFINSYRFLKARHLPEGEDSNEDGVALGSLIILALEVGLSDQEKAMVWAGATEADGVLGAINNLDLISNDEITKKMENGVPIGIGPIGWTESWFVDEDGNRNEANFQLAKGIVRKFNSFKELPEGAAVGAFNRLIGAKRAHALTRLTFRRPY